MVCLAVRTSFCLPGVHEQNCVITEVIVMVCLAVCACFCLSSVHVREKLCKLTEVIVMVCLAVRAVRGRVGVGGAGAAPDGPDQAWHRRGNKGRVFELCDLLGSSVSAGSGATCR